MIKELNKDNTYVCSDPHFKHQNIISGVSRWADKSCCRPFKDIDHHDETIINNWNAKVPFNGIVICLGDFMFGRDYLEAEKYLFHLNFRELYFIHGNHDRAMENLFRERGNYIDIYNKKIINCNHYLEVDFHIAFKYYQKFIFSHYPMITWNGKHKGSIMAFGHEHGHINSWIDTHLPDDKLIDVGMECINYTPISISEIMTKMKDKVAGQHHGK